MRKTACVFVLIASICFQGAALAKQILAWDGSGDASHSMLHAEAVPHHHHPHDGSIHKDLSKKSKQHVQSDHCASVAGIPPSAIRTLGPQPAPGIAAAEPRGHDCAFIEGLKRPPRTTA